MVRTQYSGTGACLAVLVWFESDLYLFRISTLLAPLLRPPATQLDAQYVSSLPHKWLARTQGPFHRPRPPASLPTVMKDLKPRQHRRAFVLSQDKNQFLVAPLSKRAGKQPVYYDIPTSVHGVHAPTSFQQLIERRAHHGEVVRSTSSRRLAATRTDDIQVIRRESPEDWGPEYQVRACPCTLL